MAKCDSNAVRGGTMSVRNKFSEYKKDGLLSVHKSVGE
jgi:hypothetical protein